jgi:hypothetical protein
MMVTPLPGTSPRALLFALSEAYEGGLALKNAPGITPARYRDEFIRWFKAARDRIGTGLSASDREQVLSIAIAWRVTASLPPNPDALAYGLIASEFDLALERIQVAHESLRQTIERLNQIPGVLVVLDTSVLIQHRNKLAELLIADDLGERNSAVRMVIPIVVVDELDRLKESTKKDVRWRAAHSLGKLDELLGQAGGDGTGPVSLSDGRPTTDGTTLPVGPAYVEVLHDPREHVRLPNADDEIIDRALALRDAAQGTNRLRLVTFDTGQHLRARAAGLEVTKLERADHYPDRCEPCGRDF